MNAVELIDVVKEYPGGVTAVRGVTLAIGYGELVGIVGPSGAGKTTVLHLIGTLARPSAGLVRVDGTDVGSSSDRRLSALRARRIGFVFQQFPLVAGQSAVDTVADGLLYAGMAVKQRRQRAQDALFRVGLGARMNHRPQELSGGERRRLAVARAVAGGPALLLADEPTGNLDNVSGAAVMDLLRELHGAGTTVVVITNDWQVAGMLPRRIVLHDGRVI